MYNLNNMAYNWRQLGIQLGIKLETLDTIAESYYHKPQNCMSGMLNTWLKQQVDPPPTWADIIDAIESLGDKQLGRKLREKYNIQ